eukprot:SAG31_NODE_4732_length_2994_cov_1.539710_2_plen_505_part_00
MVDSVIAVDETKKYRTAGDAALRSLDFAKAIQDYQVGLETGFNTDSHTGKALEDDLLKGIEVSKTAMGVHDDVKNLIESADRIVTKDPEKARETYAKAATMLEKCATETGYADGTLRARLEKSLMSLDPKAKDSEDPARLLKAYLEHPDRTDEELRSLCSQRGKDSKGSRVALIARLRPVLMQDADFMTLLKEGKLVSESDTTADNTSAVAGTLGSNDDALVQDYLDAARAGELRTLLEARGLDKSGLKRVLVERLKPVLLADNDWLATRRAGGIQSTAVSAPKASSTKETTEEKRAQLAARKAARSGATNESESTPAPRKESTEEKRAKLAARKAARSSEAAPGEKMANASALKAESKEDKRAKLGARKAARSSEAAEDSNPAVASASEGEARDDRESKEDRRAKLAARKAARSSGPTLPAASTSTDANLAADASDKAKPLQDSKEEKRAKLAARKAALAAKSKNKGAVQGLRGKFAAPDQPIDIELPQRAKAKNVGRSLGPI